MENPVDGGRNAVPVRDHVGEGVRFDEGAYGWSDLEEDDAASSLTRKAWRLSYLEGDDANSAPKVPTLFP